MPVVNTIRRGSRPQARLPTEPDAEHLGRLLTPASVAARYRTTCATVRSWLVSQEMRGLRMHGRWRIAPDEILRVEGRPSDLRGEARRRALAAVPLDVEALATRWVCCAETARRRLRRGDLTSFGIGQRRYVMSDELTRWEAEISKQDSCREDVQKVS